MMAVRTRQCWFALISTLLLLSACATSPTPTPTPATVSTRTTPTPTPSEPADNERPEFEHYLPAVRLKGPVILWDPASNQIMRTNPAMTRERFLPASTFKILNSLIGLETGVVDGPDYLIRWDGTDYGLDAWNQDHTLRTAIRDSAVWYYQAVAREVGAERMATHVAAAGYGNADIGGNIDSFWLDGELRITAEEQVDFLARFVRPRSAIRD